jgi:hypothetical protein
MDILWIAKIHTYMPWMDGLKDFKLFLVIYFDNHKLIDIDYILGDVS